MAISAKLPGIKEMEMLKSILANYKLQREKFETIIEELLSKADIEYAEYQNWTDQLLDELETVSNVEWSFESRIKVLLQNAGQPHGQDKTVTPSVADLSLEPKFEKIQVPTFDGNILKFQSFRGLFENLFHNKNLSNVQKLYYLQTAMIGRASELIRNFPLSEQSYNEAWEFIVSCYDNERAKIRALFKKLQNLEPMVGVFTYWF